MERAGVKLKRPRRYEGLRSDQLNAETGNPRANVREKPSGAAPACEHALADHSRVAPTLDRSASAGAVNGPVVSGVA